MPSALNYDCPLCLYAILLHIQSQMDYMGSCNLSVRVLDCARTAHDVLSRKLAQQQNAAARSFSFYLLFVILFLFIIMIKFNFYLSGLSRHYIADTVFVSPLYHAL